MRTYQTIVALVALLVSAFVAVPLAQKDEGYSPFEQRFKAYGTLADKVAQFEMETPKMQAALYRRNIMEALTVKRYSAKQIEFLIMMHNRMTEQAFTPGTAENQELEVMPPEATKLFTREDLQKIFRVTGIGPYPTEYTSAFRPANYDKSSCEKAMMPFQKVSYSKDIANQQAFQICYCNEGWECPDGYVCEAYYGNCQPGGSCGWIFRKTCRGGCKYQPGGEV